MRISTRSTILPLDCKWLEMGLQLDEKTLRITAGSIQRYLAKLAK